MKDVRLPVNYGFSRIALGEARFRAAAARERGDLADAAKFDAIAADLEKGAKK